jgi:hypothetical protein
MAAAGRRDDHPFAPPAGSPTLDVVGIAARLLACQAWEGPDELDVFRVLLSWLLGDQEIVHALLHNKKGRRGPLPNCVCLQKALLFFAFLYEFLSFLLHFFLHFLLHHFLHV